MSRPAGRTWPRIMLHTWARAPACRPVDVLRVGTGPTVQRPRGYRCRFGPRTVRGDRPSTITSVFARPMAVALGDLRVVDPVLDWSRGQLRRAVAAEVPAEHREALRSFLLAAADTASAAAVQLRR